MADKSVSLRTLDYLNSVAVYLGQAEPGSPEWDEFRRNRIGGSEVGAIAGESKYESAYSLWAKKCGLIPIDRTDNEPMYWGRSLEPNIIRRFQEEHPELLVTSGVGTWANKQYDFMLANPDGIYEREDGSLGILEIKTARFGDDWAEGVPRYYETQVQWYLRTFGLTEAYVAVLISGSDYREYQIGADKMWQDYDLERVIAFRQCVEKQERPDWDGSESTLQTVRAMHPEIDLEASVELGELGVNYFNATYRLEEAQKEVKTFEAAILDTMGNARTALIFDRPELIRVARGKGKPYLTKKKGQ